MRKRSFRPIPEEPAMNLTPLIDVVFVILIIFIVIAPILNVDQVELAGSAPSSEHTVMAEDGPISIHVHADNTVHLNRRSISIDQLAESLKLEKLKNPKAKPQVFHDKKARFGTYQAVKNAAEIAGFDEIEIVLKPT